MPCGDSCQGTNPGIRERKLAPADPLFLTFKDPDLEQEYDRAHFTKAAYKRECIILILGALYHLIHTIKVPCSKCSRGTLDHQESVMSESCTTKGMACVSGGLLLLDVVVRISMGYNWVAKHHETHQVFTR